MSDLLGFIDRSPSPFHAVDEIVSALTKKGYEKRAEHDPWDIQPGGKYYTIRGGKSIIAWKQGTASPADAGFRILAAHTDSPVLKVKPNPARTSSEKKLLLSDVYGSPLLYSWLDRDLKLCGVVYFRDAKTGATDFRRVELDELPVRATSLAIHLNRGLRESGLKVNPQTDLHMFFADAEKSGSAELLSVLADKVGVPEADISGFDLRGADVQPSAYVGADNAFISAPRLDNLFSCYCALEALLNADGITVDFTNIGVWFDAEEIGSLTSLGARSNFLDSVLSRIATSEPGFNSQSFDCAKARSFMISADMAHAEHPSFIDRTDSEHVPRLNQGLALKSSAGANYADCGALAAWLTATCRDNGVPLQKFMYRCDHGGGASVGPLVSSATGINTIDVGSPMLAMHSIRELGGAHDVNLTISAFDLFYTQNINIHPF